MQGMTSVSVPERNRSVPERNSGLAAGNDFYCKSVKRVQGGAGAVVTQQKSRFHGESLPLQDVWRLIRAAGISASAARSRPGKQAWLVQKLLAGGTLAER